MHNHQEARPPRGRWTDIAGMGTIVQNGLVFDPRLWTREADLLSQVPLLKHVQDLFDLLEARRIPYVLVGGIALLYYVEGRNTRDLDLLLALKDLARLPEVHVTHQHGPFAQGRFRSLDLNFLLTTNPLFRRVQQEYTQTVTLLGRNVTIATLEGLLLLKLYALPSLYRPGDFTKVSLYENDIVLLMYHDEVAPESLLEVLKTYLGKGGWQSLKEIVGEIQRQVQRFFVAGKQAFESSWT